MAATVRFALASTVLLTLATVTFAADDWPQWRGPDRDGKSHSKKLLQQWPDGGPPLLWRASGLGGGYSSVAVAGSRIFTMGDLEDGQYVLALKRDGGELLWKTRVGPTWEDQYLGPRSTPTVDGNAVFVVTTEGDVYALAIADGKVLWTRSLPKDFGGKMMVIQNTNWKYSESPLVDGNRVIVTPGARDAALVALDRKSGETVWKTALPELGEKGADGAGYASVVVSEGGGRRQYVQLLGRGLVGVDADSGAFLWGYNPVANDVANIPTPLVDGNFVFSSSGYGTGAALVELKAGEGGVVAEERYFLDAKTMQNHHGGMVLDGGHVYSGTGHNKGLPLAVEMASGKVAWGPVRNDGRGSAAVSYADGRLYFRYQSGLMVLVEATSEAYREHGSFTIPDVERESWAHPVIAGGKLFLREQDNLFCYDLTVKPAKKAKKEK